MQRVKLFFSSVLLCFSAVATAKGHHGGGHGGGHGGHGGGHANSGGHPGGHAAVHSMTPHAGHVAHAKIGSRVSTGAARRTSAGTGVNQITGFRNGGPRTNGIGNRGVTTPATVVHGGYGWEHAGSYYSPAYYNPFYYSPFFNIWNFGLNFAYTPNYTNYHPDGWGYYSQAGPDDALEGYAVYANDTIQGDVTIKPNAILVETADSTKEYDYKFKIKQQELACVTVYNEDNKQLDLVRVKDYPKKLWRVVHTGRLNIYDGHFDFIYRPDDIDIRSLVVVYNGHATKLDSSDPNEIKQRLTVLVNTAYDLKLDPAKYTWNQLLVYIDKLN